MKRKIIALWIAILFSVSFYCDLGEARPEKDSESIEDDGPLKGRARSLGESWRRPTKTPPLFFYATDVGAEVRAALEQAFAAATLEWGNYGPLEYWVVGSDERAAETLAAQYCKRRDMRGDQRLLDCQEDGRQRSEFLAWAKRAADIKRTGRPFLNAGRNGNARWGIHLFSSSIPPAWAGLGDIPVEDDQKVLFHEYFHAIQHAHVLAVNHDERERLMGPVWWVEGCAEFMAHVTTEKLRKLGKLPRDSRDLENKWDTSGQMRRKLESGLKKRAEKPGLKLAEIKYGADGQIAYDLGSWAIAYLCKKTNPDVLLKTFYPQLNELGWEATFKKTFGMTPDEFYAEFDKFLALPRVRQMALFSDEELPR